MKDTRDAGRKTRRGSPGDGSLDLPVSTRKLALEALRTAVSLEPAGLMLVTGEAGIGKTWLCQRLVHELAGAWGSISIEVSEALDPLDFLRLIGEGLGIDPGERLGAARVVLARALEDDLIDGRTWLLVLEDAQKAAPAVWSEIHALARAMEAARGPGAMILTGPSELARRLAARPGSNIASRISCHVHLLPFDLDEACALMGSRDAPSPVDRALLDELHRDALGNPRRLLRAWRKGPGRGLAQTSPVALIAPARPPEPPATQEVGALDGTIRPALSAVPSEARLGQEILVRNERDLDGEPPSPAAEGPLVPSRPPIRIEEGLIEVGWEGSLEAESAERPGEELNLEGGGPPLDEGSLPSEEMVEDHYAALQAWTEWARNRGRGPSPDPGGGHVSIAPAAAPRPADGADPPLADVLRPAGLRAETQHEHAPYSQLFSRLRQSS